MHRSAELKNRWCQCTGAIRHFGSVIVWVWVLFCIAGDVTLFNNVAYPSSEESVKMENTFSGFKPGNHGANGCTPSIGDDFLGIKINGPEEIVLSKGQMILPLSGIYRFRVDYILKFGSPEEHMSIIVSNREKKKSYAGRIRSLDPILDDPTTVSIDAETAKTTYETGYFDINVLDYVSLQLVPGDYDVYVVLEEHKSNMIHIKIRP
jgi:hypothetical protein